MKLTPVNGVNVFELAFVVQRGTFSTLALFIFYFIIKIVHRVQVTDYLSVRWTAIGISYKHYCHLLTVMNSFVA